MTDNLPAFGTIDDDHHSCRIWKRILRHAGKRRTFDLLEPKIRELSKKIRNRRSSVLNAYAAVADTPIIRPTDLKRKLLDALNEIRESRDLVHATEINNDSNFDVSLFYNSRITLGVLFAGSQLVKAMLAERSFELYMMGCLNELAAIDAPYVQNVGLELQGRPT